MLSTLRNPLCSNMDDKIRVEDEAAVEKSPAPPHPRSDSAAQSPREPAGGSPCRDWIDDLVDKSIRNGKPRAKAYPRCPRCDGFWHGIRSGKCKGSADFQ